jgi:hypothetical protein
MDINANIHQPFGMYSDDCMYGGCSSHTRFRVDIGRFLLHGIIKA